MTGKGVELSPGFDHAGIATHIVVKNKILNNNKMNNIKKEINEELILKEMNIWSKEKQNDIINQMVIL